MTDQTVDIAKLFRYPRYCCSLAITRVIFILLTGRLPSAACGNFLAPPFQGSKMPTGRISKRSVDAFSCEVGKDRSFLWDTGLSGFGVCAYPGGKKTYIAQFRKDGRSRRVAVGDHGRLTPDQARSLALVMLSDVEQGADPVEQRRAARAVPTLQSVADDYLRLHVALKRKGRTEAEYRRIFAICISPTLGSKRVTDVSRAEVAKLHADLSGTPHQANRVLALISAIWNWAARRGEVQRDHNPTSNIEKYREGKRDRFLTSAEFARLGDVLREAETIGLPWTVDETKPTAKHAAKDMNRRTVIDPHAAAAIRLLILTGARLREILNAHWSDVDLERGILFLRDSKTGKKPVYLSAAAQAVIASIPFVDGNPYIIPGKNLAAPRADLNNPWSSVRRAAGLDGVRVHDLRHSFASIGAGAALGLPVIGKLLGHSQPATTQRYAHLDVDPLRRAVDTIGSTISAAMTRNVGANVTPIKGNKHG